MVCWFGSYALHRQIIDDGYKHSLIVFEDLQTRGIRLHAAVWDGELRQCPVWTAFGNATIMLSLSEVVLETSLT